MQNGKRVILKYELRPSSGKSDVEVTIPWGATVFSIQAMGTGVFLWALVDPDEKETVQRHFRVERTGDTVEWDSKLQHVATIQLMGGGLVFHVFEKKN